MDNQYRSKTIPLVVKDTRWIAHYETAAKSVVILESYKNKCNIVLTIQGLKSSSQLRKQQEEYRVILIKDSKDEKASVDLGQIIVDEEGQCNVLKKINMGVFRQEYGDIWDFNLVRVGGDDVVLEGEIVPKGEEMTLREFCAISTEEGMKLGQVEPFKEDETKAQWYRCSLENKNLNMPVELKAPLELGKRYGHYLIGVNKGHWYIAIPGRFLTEEQPYFIEGRVALWQPLRGGEELYQDIELTPRSEREYIYGYWIGKVSGESGQMVEF